MNDDMYGAVTNRLIDLIRQGPEPWRRPWHGVSDLSHSDEISEREDTKTNVPIRDEDLGDEGVQLYSFTAQSAQSVLKRFPIESCETIIAGMRDPPIIRHEGEECFYYRPEDVVWIPEKWRFFSPELYYNCLFHEMVHATGHDNRMSRRCSVGLGGDLGRLYCREELLAETGAAFLSAHAGIHEKTLANSAAYLDYFVKRLGYDPHELANTAPAAREAIEYILGKQEIQTSGHAD